MLIHQTSAVASGDLTAETLSKDLIAIASTDGIGSLPRATRRNRARFCTFFCPPNEEF